MNVTPLKILLILFSSLMLTACKKDEEGTKPERKLLIEAVYASGFVVSKDEHQVYAQVEGYVTDKLAQDGDAVKKGDPLYIIDADQQSARNRIAKETYTLALQNAQEESPVLRELHAAKESAFTKLRFDSANFIRYQNLIKSNATSQAEYERIKLIYENSQQEYRAHKSRYVRTKNQLSLELQNAKNNLLIASNESGRYIIRSEMDGLVFMMSKERGEMIRRSEVVAVVGKKDAYYLQLSVDELDVQRIVKNQEVLVKIDAYPDSVFHATVSKIYPIVDRKQQSIRVDAELTEQLPGWFSGLALEANIIIRRKDNAVVIPKSKLLPGDSVFIETEKGVRKIKIKKGIETLDEVEVIEPTLLVNHPQGNSAKNETN
jgi:HlyD family secretion protein